MTRIGYLKKLMPILYPSFYVLRNSLSDELVLEIGRAVANNLLHALGLEFPDKKFIVFLEVNVKDSTIVRFHQQWDDELPYFDLNQTYQEGVELYEFRSR